MESSREDPSSGVRNGGSQARELRRRPKGATPIPLYSPKHPSHDVASVQGKEHVVLCVLKRSQNELSSYQPKVFKIDDHMGIAISGLTADGRILSQYMRNECLDHRSCPDMWNQKCEKE